jgi:hypothetical protein
MIGSGSTRDLGHTLARAARRPNPLPVMSRAAGALAALRRLRVAASAPAEPAAAAASWRAAAAHAAPCACAACAGAARGATTAARSEPAGAAAPPDEGDRRVRGRASAPAANVQPARRLACSKPQHTPRPEP